MTKTRDFARVVRRELASDPQLAEAVELEAIGADIAMKLFELRAEAGLTQAQLADRAGTHQSVIARLEDADYSGYSVKTLNRIAKALGKRVRFEFYACAEPPADAAVRTWQMIDVKWAGQQQWQPKIDVEVQSSPAGRCQLTKA